MPSLFERTARDPRYIPSPASRPAALLLPIACIAFALAWIAAYAALIPLGEWRADEWDTFAFFREHGLGYLRHRTINWSFRPLSEVLLYLYAQAGFLTERQLIAPFLALLWLGLGIAMAAAVFPQRRFGGRELLLASALVSTLLALFLGGRRVDEVFYWTQGAVAYVPTIAAIAYLVLSNLFTTADDLSRLRWGNAAAGVVAALSSEVGATFAAAYAGATLAAMLLWPARRGDPLLRRRDAEFAFPLAAGLGVILMLASKRLGTTLETFGDKAVAHRPSIGLQASLEAFPHEVLSAAKGIHLSDALDYGALILPLLALGAFGIFRAIGRSRAPEMPVRVAAIAVALVGAAFLSLFAGFYQFGADCCSRHAATRYPMVALAVVCLAWIAAGWRRHEPTGRRASRWTLAAPVALASAAGLNGAKTFDALAEDYRTYGARLAQTEANWDAGLAPGSSMVFVPMTGRFVCWQHIMVDGTYVLGPDMPPNARYLARFFGKPEVRIAGAGPGPLACPPV
ncbi:hypothetical protein [Aureimonas sp. SK2]|uniref:hypothetical protein n=1 Tax=Aureimonas sp. SK2 TaxID=3015992 RepID=UPI002444B1F5|nr:hypothetical protein [Aureimonas sp. SK2]